jgi:DNA-binding NtrC family response regulator
MLSTGREILPEHLPPRFQNPEPGHGRVTIEIGTPLKDAERALIQRTLAAVNNNRSQAARLLGISRRTLYNKLEEFDRKDFSG